MDSGGGTGMAARTFRGSTLREALERVRAALGSEAVIFSRREVAKRGWLGLGAQRWVEVVAARESSLAEPAQAGIRVEPRFPAAATGVGQVASSGTRPAWQGITNVFPEWSETRTSAKPEVPEARAEGEAWIEWQERLIAVGVEPETAQRILDRVAAEVPGAAGILPGRVVELIRDVITERLPGSQEIAVEPGRRRIVALVGSAGSGKTTSVMKLAADFAHERGVSCGVLSVDHRRVTALEELRIHAEVLGISSALATEPRMVPTALENLAGCGLLLVDTPGTSPRDPVALEELQELLNPLEPDEVHLVLSATDSAHQQRQVVERFRAVGINRILLTRLDELDRWGSLVGVLSGVELPMSYFCRGSQIPDDLEPADGRKLTEMILGWEGVLA